MSGEPNGTGETSPRILALVQARMGSTRLPGKAMRLIEGKPLLGWVLDRLEQSQRLDGVVVATSDLSTDDAIVDYCAQRSCPVFRGSESDVLARTYEAAKLHGGELIVRITGDCPLIDPMLIDQMVDYFYSQGPFDYLSNTHDRSFPHGLDVEILPFKRLADAHWSARSPEEREHVTPYLYRRPSCYRIGRFQYRLTVDTVDDLELFARLQRELNQRGWKGSYPEVLALLRENPDWVAANQHVMQKSVERWVMAPATCDSPLQQSDNGTTP